MKKYTTPILFIIFNRTETALTSFQRIKDIKPEKLYIASDGPRENVKNEKDIVYYTREQIINAINWECDVHTLFQNNNLGCGVGVYTAINWFFEENEEGIILEDDCVVEPSFFHFMEEMLNKYRTDERIGMIAGTNPIKLNNYKYSYLFSKYKSCWGWASWKRAWNNMDINMSWREINYNDVLFNAGYNGKDISGWKYKIKCIDNNIVSAWDWQWYFSLASQNQLCIYPINNLVSNIGTDINATHTSFSDITLKSYPMTFPINHPCYVVPNNVFDKLFYLSSNNIRIKLARLIPIKYKKKLKKIIFKILK